MSAKSYTVYPFPLPTLTIKIVPGGVARMSYSETLYELVSKHPIKDEHWKHLDACGLIGIGQAYSVISTETLNVESQPLSVDRTTGMPTGEPPVAGNGEPVTKPHTYAYHRYVVRRICDSGD